MKNSLAMIKGVHMRHSLFTLCCSSILGCRWGHGVHLQLNCVHAVPALFIIESMQSCDSKERGDSCASWCRMIVLVMAPHPFFPTSWESSPSQYCLKDNLALNRIVCINNRLSTAFQLRWVFLRHQTAEFLTYLDIYLCVLLTASQAQSSASVGFLRHQTAEFLTYLDIYLCVLLTASQAQSSASVGFLRHQTAEFLTYLDIYLCVLVKLRAANNGRRMSISAGDTSIKKKNVAYASHAELLS